jgi:hypothetical protein
VYLEWYQAWCTAFRKRPVRHKERKCALSGRFQLWDNRHEQPCPHCHSPYKFGDPCHLLVCAGAPPAFRLRGARPWPRHGSGGAGRSRQASVRPAGGRVYSGASPPLRLSDEGKCAPGAGSYRDAGGRVVYPRLPCTWEESFQASQGRPRLVYVPTAVQLFAPACFACLRTLSVFAALCCSLEFILLLAPNTGRRCTQGGTRPDFHSLCKWPVCPKQKTNRGLPCLPLFGLFAEPLTERLRARSTGVELCANKDFTRCLLLADDTCLVASSLSDLSFFVADWPLTKSGTPGLSDLQRTLARRLLSVGGRGGYGLQHEEEPPTPTLRAPTGCQHRPAALWSTAAVDTGGDVPGRCPQT